MWSKDSAVSSLHTYISKRTYEEDMKLSYHFEPNCRPETVPIVHILRERRNVKCCLLSWALESRMTSHKSDYFACIESQLLNIMNVELPFSLLDVGDHGYCPSLLLERPKYVIIYNILSLTLPLRLMFPTRLQGLNGSLTYTTPIK